MLTVLNNSVTEKVRDQVNAHVWKQVRERVASQVRYHLWEQVGDLANEQVRLRILSKLWRDIDVE